MSALGIFDNCASDFIDMLTDLEYDTATRHFIIGKRPTIAIRTSYFIFCRQGRIQSWSFGGHNPELDFGGHKCPFHVKIFVTLLFAIGSIAVWGAMAPCLPWIRPCLQTKQRVAKS